MAHLREIQKGKGTLAPRQRPQRHQLHQLLRLMVAVLLAVLPAAAFPPRTSHIQPAALLDLTNSLITTLRPNNFTALVSETLILDRNFLTEIRIGDFDTETFSIATLSIAHNFISYIEPGSLNINRLANLDLSDNRLETINYPTFAFLPLKYLNLNGNPIKALFEQEFEAFANHIELLLDSPFCSCNKTSLQQNLMQCSCNQQTSLPCRRAQIFEHCNGLLLGESTSCQTIAIEPEGLECVCFDGFIVWLDCNSAGLSCNAACDIFTNCDNLQYPKCVRGTAEDTCFYASNDNSTGNCLEVEVKASPTVSPCSTQYLCKSPRTAPSELGWIQDPEVCLGFAIDFDCDPETEDVQTPGPRILAGGSCECGGDISVEFSCAEEHPLNCELVCRLFAACPTLTPQTCIAEGDMCYTLSSQPSLFANVVAIRAVHGDVTGVCTKSPLFIHSRPVESGPSCTVTSPLSNYCDAGTLDTAVECGGLGCGHAAASLVIKNTSGDLVTFPIFGLYEGSRLMDDIAPEVKSYRISYLGANLCNDSTTFEPPVLFESLSSDCPIHTQIENAAIRGISLLILYVKFWRQDLGASPALVAAPDFGPGYDISVFLTNDFTGSGEFFVSATLNNYDPLSFEQCDAVQIEMSEVLASKALYRFRGLYRVVPNKRSELKPVFMHVSRGSTLVWITLEAAVGPAWHLFESVSRASKPVLRRRINMAWERYDDELHEWGTDTGVKEFCDNEVPDTPEMLAIPRMGVVDKEIFEILHCDPPSARCLIVHHIIVDPDWRLCSFEVETAEDTLSWQSSNFHHVLSRGDCVWPDLQFLQFRFSNNLTMTNTGDGLRREVQQMMLEPPIECPPDTFRCRDNSRCFTFAETCDGVVHCPLDRSDEMFCMTHQDVMVNTQNDLNCEFNPVDTHQSLTHDRGSDIRLGCLHFELVCHEHGGIGHCVEPTWLVFSHLPDGYHASIVYMPANRGCPTNPYDPTIVSAEFDGGILVATAYVEHPTECNRFVDFLTAKPGDDLHGALVFPEISAQDVPPERYRAILQGLNSTIFRFSANCDPASLYTPDFNVQCTNPGLTFPWQDCVFTCKSNPKRTVSASCREGSPFPPIDMNCADECGDSCGSQAYCKADGQRMTCTCITPNYVYDAERKRCDAPVGPPRPELVNYVAETQRCPDGFAPPTTSLLPVQDPFLESLTMTMTLDEQETCEPQCVPGSSLLPAQNYDIELGAECFGASMYVRVTTKPASVSQYAQATVYVLSTLWSSYKFEFNVGGYLGPVDDGYCHAMQPESWNIRPFNLFDRIPMFDVKVEACVGAECPVDCVLSPWGAWSPCPTCGSVGVFRTRKRTVHKPPVASGKPCDSLVDSALCPAKGCLLSRVARVTPATSAPAGGFIAGFDHVFYAHFTPTVAVAMINFDILGSSSTVLRIQEANTPEDFYLQPLLAAESLPWKFPVGFKEPRVLAIMSMVEIANITVEFDTFGNCTVHEWTDWSPCSRICGLGVQVRTRVVSSECNFVESSQSASCMVSEKCSTPQVYKVSSATCNFAKVAEPVIECLQTEFACPGSTACLTLDQVCDGHADCPGGEDEMSFDFERQVDIESQGDEESQPVLTAAPEDCRDFCGKRLRFTKASPDVLNVHFRETCEFEYEPKYGCNCPSTVLARRIGPRTFKGAAMNFFDDDFFFSQLPSELTFVFQHDNTLLLHWQHAVSTKTLQFSQSSDSLGLCIPDSNPCMSAVNEICVAPASCVNTPQFAQCIHPQDACNNCPSNSTCQAQECVCDQRGDGTECCDFTDVSAPVLCDAASPCCWQTCRGRHLLGGEGIITAQGGIVFEQSLPEPHSFIMFSASVYTKTSANRLDDELLLVYADEELVFSKKLRDYVVKFDPCDARDDGELHRIAFGFLHTDPTTRLQFVTSVPDDVAKFVTFGLLDVLITTEEDVCIDHKDCPDGACITLNDLSSQCICAPGSISQLQQQTPDQAETDICQELKDTCAELSWTGCDRTFACCLTLCSPNSSVVLLGGPGLQSLDIYEPVQFHVSTQFASCKVHFIISGPWEPEDKLIIHASGLSFPWTVQDMDLPSRPISNCTGSSKSVELSLMASAGLNSIEIEANFNEPNSQLTQLKSFAVAEISATDLATSHPCLQGACRSLRCVPIGEDFKCLVTRRITITVYSPADNVGNANCATTDAWEWTVMELPMDMCTFIGSARSAGSTDPDDLYSIVTQLPTGFYKVESFLDEKCTGTALSTLEQPPSCSPAVPVWTPFLRRDNEGGVLYMRIVCDEGCLPTPATTTTTRASTESTTTTATSALTTVTSLLTTTKDDILNEGGDPSSSSSSSGGSGVFIAVGALAGVLAIMVAVLGFIVLRRTRVERQKRRRIEHELEELRHTRAAMESNILSNYVENALLLDSNVNVPIVASSRIRLGRELGRGQFGTVHLALVNGRECAVKMLNECRPSDRLSLLREIKLMAALSHPHILELLYMCDDNNNLCMVVEYMANGDLLRFLREGRAQFSAEPAKSTDQFLSYAVQLADAMSFLESHRVIHRDLACRNLLVASDPATIKLADLGLSRVLGGDSDYYRKTSDDRVPARWMAPESMKSRIYTISSDVWSYGVTVWEMFSLGNVPYGAMNALEAVRAVGDGYRLVRPDLCPKQIFTIVRSCWALEPDERPSFSLLLESLQEIQQSGDGAEPADLPVHAWMDAADSQV
eukprot:m.28936 g.28936  ORF g.28936 m.28936 type:complete len:2696 (-) comp5030_c0_seq2:50-8137(-)